MMNPSSLMRTVFLALLVAGGLRAAAVNVDFSVRPEEIRLGESARVTFTVEGNITSFDPKLGSIPGIQVSGPQVQQSFQSVNGRQRNYTTYVYMVMPQQTGKYPIGPFEFVDGSGTKRELKAVTLNVLAPGATRNSAAGAAKISDLLQLELLPSKSEVYPQEVFDLTFQLYYRQVNPADDFQLRDFSAPGMDIEQPVRLGSVRQERDGVLWNVIRWRAKAKALRTGAFEITPTMTVGLLTDAGGDDDFFLIRPRSMTQTDVTAPTMKLTCKDLPAEGRPASFNGAIGAFDFRASLQPDKIAQGDPVTLTMIVGGKGNVENIGAPSLPEDPRIRRYDPKLVLNDIAQGGNQGRKGYEQILMPVDAAVKEIPAIEFSYFNTEDGQYHVVKQGPFPITVIPSTNANQRVIGLAGAPSSVQPVQKLGADIQYLKPVPARPAMAGDKPWFLRPAVVLAQLIPLLGTVATLLLARRRDRLAGDPRAARRLQAPRAARAALQQAADEAGKGDFPAALQSLQAAIRDYTANRFNLGLGEISSELILDRFGKLDLPLAQGLATIFASCENARYGGAGDQSADTLAQLLRDTRQILAKLEGIRS